MNVKEAMSAPVRVCKADTSLDDIARMMWESDCGSIPVVSDDNKPIGIVTDRDIALAAMFKHQPLWEIHASVVIEGKQPCCTSHDETIESCLRTMEQNAVRRIMVTDDRGALCGILSLGDAVLSTSPQITNRGRIAVSAEPLLGMLRKVSGHHPSAGLAI